MKPSSAMALVSARSGGGLDETLPAQPKRRVPVTTPASTRWSRSRVNGVIFGLLRLGGFDGRHLLLELFLQRRQVEARARLHRREVQEGLSRFADLLLHEDEAPELVGVPVVVSQRSVGAVRQSSPLERIEAQIDEDRPIRL